MFKVRFDNAMNPERPTLLLSSRSGKIIGQIEADDIDIKDSLKESIEMNFVVYKEKNGVRYPYWDDIINFRLIYWKEHDVWFELTVEFDESEDAIKTCFCTQLGQAELSQINLYNYEINTQNDILRDTYSPTVIYNESNPDGSLLNRLLEKAPHYSVVHVDDSIKNLQRTYTFDNKTIYDALLEVADDIGAIVRVSPIDGETGSGVKRGIAMYDMLYHCTNCGYRSEYLDDGDTCPECHSAEIEHGYGEDTTIFVTRDELAQSIGLSADTDSVKNCYRLSAGDDLMNATVRNINANNSDYMWYLSGDITADMSDGLRNALEAYQEDYVEYHTGEYPIPDHSLVVMYNSLIDKYKNSYADYMRYVYSIPSGDLPSGKAITKIPETDSVNGYNNLVMYYYDATDFYWYVKSAFMPTTGMQKTNAVRQCGKLESRVTKVAVSNMDNVNSDNKTPVDTAVLEMAQATLYPGYEAKITSSTFTKTATGGTWTGFINVVNTSNPDGENMNATTNQMSVVVTDDYEEFVLLKIKRTTAQNNVGEITLDEIFDHDLATFKLDIKKFSLDELTNMMKIAQACTEIMIEQAYEETWAPGGELHDMYVDYVSKMNAIIEEQGDRTEELEVIESMMVIINNIMTDTKESLDLKNYLNNAQGGPYWNEFSMYRREDEYSNSNFISDGLTNKELCARAQEFLDEAENSVYKAIEQQYTISTSLNNLMTVDKFKPLLDSFAVGNWMRVLADNRIYKLRLMGYTINFGDMSTVSVDLSEASRSGKGMVGSVSTIQDIVNNATKTVTITYNNDVSPVFESALNQTNTTASIASTSAMKSTSDIGGRNILMDTDAPTISKQYAQYDRLWVDTTGTAGSREYITFSGNDLPPINVTHGVRFTISATSATGARSVRWYSNGTVPIKDATKYTLSCYARVTSGDTMALWFGYSNGSTTGKTYNISNTEWKKYSWKFTYISGNSGPYIYVGCRPTYTGTIEVCGFQLERGGTSSDWKQSPEDDLGQSEAMATSLIADFDQKIMARYGISMTAGNQTAKTVTINNFELEEGAMVAVQFRNANTVATPTLNVFSNGVGTGAHYIRINKALLPAASAKTYSYTDSGGQTVSYSTSDNVEYSGWTTNSLVHFVYVKGSGTTDSSSTDHSDDSNMYYWDIIDASALSKIDNILTENIVGTNGYINFGAGQFDFGNGALLFNGTDLKVKGTIYADAGAIGNLQVNNGSLAFGKTSINDNGNGIYIGSDGVYFGKNGIRVYSGGATRFVGTPTADRGIMMQRVQLSNTSAETWPIVGQIYINGTYANSPFVFSFLRRTDSLPTTVIIKFTNVNSTDPSLERFEISGYCADVAINRETNSTWNLYIKTGGINECFYLYDATNAQDKIFMTFSDVYGGGTLPSTAVLPTKIEHHNNSGINAESSDGTAIGVSSQNSLGKVGVYVAASGNRGLYDYTRGAWICYYNATNTRNELSGTTHCTGAVSSSSTISATGSICSGGKAAVWDSNAGGIMSAGGVLSLRANSSTTPGLYVTAYGSTTTTYDAGFYYNATETRWQANKQIYAPSFYATGRIDVGTTSVTGSSTIHAITQGREIELITQATGTCGLYDITNSKWIAYMSSSGVRGPVASTTEVGFMSVADKTKLNALGTLKGTTTGSGGTVTVPGTSTWTKYGTALTFDEAGLWLVIVNATFDSNSTGRRGLTIDQVTGTWAAYQPEAGTQIHTDIRPASATSYARVVGLVSVAENDMYAINLWSSAGSSTSLTATVRYTCVRLRDN